MDLMIGPDDRLYAGGGRITGDEVVNDLTYWDGIRWRPLWDGQGAVAPLMLYSLMAIRSMREGVFRRRVAQDRGIGRWDGDEWSALGQGFDNNRLADALAIDGDGNLYAGGHIEAVGGVEMNNVAKWDGSQWSSLGGSGCNSESIAVSGRHGS